MNECTLIQCLPAYIVGGIALLWNAYHEWLIHHTTKAIPLLVAQSNTPL